MVARRARCSRWRRRLLARHRHPGARTCRRNCDLLRRVAAAPAVAGGRPRRPPGVAVDRGAPSSRATCRAAAWLGEGAEVAAGAPVERSVARAAVRHRGRAPSVGRLRAAGGLPRRGGRHGRGSDPRARARRSGSAADVRPLSVLGAGAVVASGTRGRRRAGARASGAGGSHDAQRWSRAAPGSSGRRWSTGCWPRATRSTSSTTSRPARWPTWPRPGPRRAGRCTIHQLDIRLPELVDLMARAPARGRLPPRRAGRRRACRCADPVFDADVNVLGSLNVLEGGAAGRVRAGGLRGQRRHPLRGAGPARAARARVPSAPAALPLRGVEEGGHRLPGRLPRAARARVLPPWRWPTSTGPARTPTARPAWSPSSPSASSAASRSPSTATASRPATSSTSTTSWTPSSGPRPGAAASSATSAPARETSVNELYRTMAAAAGVEPPARLAPPAPGRGPAQQPRHRAGGDPARAGARGPLAAARPVLRARRARRLRRGRRAPGADRRPGPTVSGTGPRPGGRTISAAHRARPEPRGGHAPHDRRRHAAVLAHHQLGAPAISSATQTSVATSSRRRRRACPAGRHRRHPGAADGDVGHPLAPRPAERVGHDHADLDAEPAPEPAADPPGRAVGVDGQQRGRALGDVGEVDAGVGADEPVAGLGDQRARPAGAGPAPTRTRPGATLAPGRRGRSATSRPSALDTTFWVTTTTSPSAQLGGRSARRRRRAHRASTSPGRRPGPDLADAARPGTTARSAAQASAVTEHHLGQRRGPTGRGHDGRGDDAADTLGLDRRRQRRGRPRRSRTCRPRTA